MTGVAVLELHLVEHRESDHVGVVVFQHGQEFVRRSSQVCTNVVSWDDQMGEFLNKTPVNATLVEFTITTDGASGDGVPKSSRAVREEEKRTCHRRTPKCSSFRDQVAQFESCGSKVAAIIEELVHHHEEALNPVVRLLGRQNQVSHGS